MILHIVFLNKCIQKNSLQLQVTLPLTEVFLFLFLCFFFQISVSILLNGLQYKKHSGTDRGLSLQAEQLVYKEHLYN